MSSSTSAIDHPDDPLSIPTESVRVLVRVRPLLSNELNAAASNSSRLTLGDQNIKELLQQYQYEHQQQEKNDGNSDENDHQSPNKKEILRTRITLACDQTSNTTMGQEVPIKSHQYSFDAVLSPLSCQRDVFEMGGVRNMLTALLQGYNSTIFAYGQTGSG
jgi:hypothetical protein